MSHESVWYSRPRNYGKGAREWSVNPREERRRIVRGDQDGGEIWKGGFESARGYAKNMD